MHVYYTVQSSDSTQAINTITLLNWLEPEADLSFMWNKKKIKCIYNLIIMIRA